MTAFDFFQQATCQIAETDYDGACASLLAAVRHIDMTGTDRHMREDILQLLTTVREKANG